LAIESDYLVADSYQLLQGLRDGTLCTAEPEPREFWKRFVDLLRLAGARSRVVLTGEGGDQVAEGAAWVPGWFSPLRTLAVARDTYRYWRRHRSLPRLGARSWLRRQARPAAAPALPLWINKQFAARLDLASRLREHQEADGPCAVGETLRSTFWGASLFRAYDPGFNGLPVEVRHPFFDLRVVAFLRSVPAFPWLYKKELLRMALAGRLPDAVTWRPKPQTSGDPGTRLLRQSDPEMLAPQPLLEHIAGFVDIQSFRGALPDGDGREAGTGWAIRPLSLGCWLAQERSGTLREYHEN
jgi:asparagine synthase (glutamine-hydrolysing)